MTDASPPHLPADPEARRQHMRELGRRGGHARAATMREKHRRESVQGYTSVLSTMADPLMFGAMFAGPSWDAWRTFLRALDGQPLEGEQFGVFTRHTGRDRPPTVPVSEAVAICGRRGGKSRIAALLAVHRATCRPYTLAPGERGVVMVLAADRRQARVVFNYIAGLLNSTPVLKALIEKERRESVDLRNGLSIEVHTASFKSVRGFTVIAAICDEMAFWASEDSANPDREILDALRPAMATVRGSLLLCISTPYARRGEVWRAFEQHYGKDSPVLVWRADTRSMNPSVPEQVIAEAYERDPQAAAAEYGAEFRRDVEAFISREVLEAVTAPGRHELPPREGVFYHAFTDPSGGSQDAFTLAIAHREGDAAVLDLLREVRPPFSPEQVVADFAAVLRPYRAYRVHGDRYGGEWPREQFRKAGLEYTVSERTKSDLYKAVLPLLNSGRAELLDHARLRTQFEALERRVARGGKDSIDHPPGGRDDVANSAAGALVLAAAVDPLDQLPPGALSINRDMARLHPVKRLARDTFAPWRLP